MPSIREGVEQAEENLAKLEGQNGVYTYRKPTLDETYNFAFKLMLLGDSCTGKTCLLIRFRDGTFLNNNFISTVGIDYRTKVVDVDDVKVKLQIWDTAGQERFRSITHAYYRDADALLLLFDVTNRISFENVRNWLAEIKEYANESVFIYLIGNKCDLTAKRKVTAEEATSLADTYKIPYLETSAKTGQNVQDAFMNVANILASAKTGKSAKTNLNLNSTKGSDFGQKSWCCGYS